MPAQAQKWFLIVFILVWPTMAQANIGENIGQLRARYGSAKQVGNQMLFQVHIVDDKLVRMADSSSQNEGYSISVYFDGILSAMEVFTRIASDPAKSDISQADIDHILAGESDGNTWNSIPVHSGKPTWVRSDNKLIARFSESASGTSDSTSALVIMLNSK
jgi:hypothetical protein